MRSRRALSITVAIVFTSATAFARIGRAQGTQGMPIQPIAQYLAGSDAPLPSLGGGRVVGQVVGGVVGLPIGYVAGGLAVRTVVRATGASRDAASDAALFGAYAGSALGTAGAVSLIGARGPGRGSFLAATGGAAGGIVASKLIARLLRGRDDAPVTPPCRLACVTVSALLVALPSAGATVAYNATRSR